MEYLTKAEVKSHRIEFQIIIEEVRAVVKEQKISFTYGLIGSAKRNMVLLHHNKGYDCDYKITIQKNENKLSEYDVKMLFIKAFNKALVPRDYSHCEDSTQAISVKEVNPNESKIIKGYDIIITKNSDKGTEILRNDKVKFNSSDYHYVLMSDTKNFHENYAKIAGNSMWKDLRALYRKKRIANGNLIDEQQKKGFQLLSEATNEVLIKYNIELS